MGLTLKLFRLDGRVAIVTGASRGIGCSIADSLTSAGASVIGIGRSLGPELKTKRFIYKICDVTDSQSFNLLARQVYDEFSKIDILINAAGITLPALAQTDPLEAFRRTISNNLTSLYSCCTAVLPFMKQSTCGSIVNITSIGAKIGFPDNPGYIASKGGLAALSRALAVDYAVHGIRVNSLVPGYIRTDMTEFSYKQQDLYQKRTERTILGRWGAPEDLNGAAIFLASDASRYVTGIDLIVDGGWTAKGL